MTTIDAKRALNLGLPVSRLPTDVLSQLFCGIRDRYTAPLQSGGSSRKFGWGPGPHKPPWAVITQVCHTWREVAIQTPLLWTHIILLDSRDVKWAKEMLPLSKQCPLVVTLELYRQLPWSSGDQLYNDVKSSLGRSRVLNLHNVEPFSLLSFSSGSDFSQLESLRIHYNMYRPNWESTPPYEIISRTKSLQHLQITSGHIDSQLGSPSLLRLTHLVLDKIPRSRLRCHSLVAILSRMSVLEVLHLIEAFLNETDHKQVAASKGRVFLESLKQLYLSSNICNIDLFLQHIQVSRMCGVWLESTTSIQDKTQLGQILSWNFENFRPPQEPDGRTRTATIPQNFLQSFFLDLSNPSSVEVRGFHEFVSLGELIDGNPLFKLIFGYDSGISRKELLWLPLVSLPLSRVVFLGIRANSNDYMDVHCETQEVGKVHPKSSP
jgi:hypothetical protein